MGLYDGSGPLDGYTPCVDAKREQSRNRQGPIPAFRIPETFCPCPCHGAGSLGAKKSTNDYLYCDPCRMSMGDLVQAKLADDPLEGD